METGLIIAYLLGQKHSNLPFRHPRQSQSQHRGIGVRLFVAKWKIGQICTCQNQVLACHPFMIIHDG